jgi:hypothetical protein
MHGGGPARAWALARGGGWLPPGSPAALPGREPVPRVWGGSGVCGAGAWGAPPRLFFRRGPLLHAVRPTAWAVLWTVWVPWAAGLTCGRGARGLTLFLWAPGPAGLSGFPRFPCSSPPPAFYNLAHRAHIVAGQRAGASIHALSRRTLRLPVSRLTSSTNARPSGVST